jgi:hypothetical protein
VAKAIRGAPSGSEFSNFSLFAIAMAPQWTGSPDSAAGDGVSTPCRLDRGAPWTGHAETAIAIEQNMYIQWLFVYDGS